VALFKTTSEVSVDNDAANKAKQLSPWKIAIIDDEPGIHDVTKFALSHFELEGRKLAFYSSFSAEDGFILLRDEPDIALAFIDVVMENDHAGLDLVERIRGELNNHSTRIILRTGQPGSAPEERVIR
jgi:CheY-like chemotaxis protein